MRQFLLVLLCSVALVGCERTAPMPGPTVEKFVGKLLADGKATTFDANDQVILNLTHSSGQSFGVPIKPDGTFTVGEMPIGKYSATLKVTKGNAAQKTRGAGAQNMFNVSGGFEIKDGQTEYTVDLGKSYKP